MSGTMIQSGMLEVLRDYVTNPGLKAIADDEDKENRKPKSPCKASHRKSVQPKYDTNTLPILHRFSFSKISIVTCPRFHLGTYEPVLLTSEQLCTITDSYNKNNLIGETQFGELYHGKIVLNSDPFQTREVMVKTWDNSPKSLGLIDYENAVDEEKLILTQPSTRNHPGLLKLIGFCQEYEMQGMVYDFKALDTVHNLISKADTFTWLQRIKVAMGYARILEFLHRGEKPYFVRNVSAAHIVVDKDYNPKILDFCLMSGGNLGKITAEKEYIYYAYGYADIKFAPVDDQMLVYHDVYSYGILLLVLVAKKSIVRHDVESAFVDRWAKKAYSPGCSLVHESLVEEPGFYDSDARLITELGMRCLERELDQRPSMKKVIESLEGLLVCSSGGLTSLEG